MIKKADAATIGAFVTGALVLTIIAVVVWGSGRLFRKSVHLVCYFDQSVNGLEVGAPVKVRGLVVGKVTHILLRYRQAQNDVRIPVFIDVDVKRLTELGARTLGPERYQDLIARGLRARLDSQSVITGTLFVSIGSFPDTPVVLSELDPDHGLPELPTLPSQLAEASRSVTEILAGLKEVDFAGLITSINHAATSIDQLASMPAIGKTLTAATAALQSYKQLSDHLDAGLPPLFAQAGATIAEARKTLVGLDGATGAAGRLLSPEAPVSTQLNDALANVGRASNAVRELADYLRRNPNALLVGKSQ